MTPSLLTSAETSKAKQPTQATQLPLAKQLPQHVPHKIITRGVRPKGHYATPACALQDDYLWCQGL
jgi:hypothetical protein